MKYKEEKTSHMTLQLVRSLNPNKDPPANVDLVQYLTHSILLSYTWVQGGIGFSVGNEAAPSNISPKNGRIGPQLDNLYNLGMSSFQNIKSKVAHFNPKLTAALGAWSIKSYMHAPK
jgi:hypothetical protein